MISVWETETAKEIYYVNTAEYRAETPGIRVQAVCYSLLYPAWKNVSRPRPYYIVSLILSGHDLLSAPDGKELHLGPGSFKISDLNTPAEALQRTDRDTLERYFMLLEVTPLLTDMLSRMFPAGFPAFTAPFPARLKKCFEDLRDILSPPKKTDDILASAMAVRLFLEAARQFPHKSVPPPLGLALSYIDNHFCEPTLNRERVAAAACVSVSTLGRLFRAHLDTTIQERIASLRMAKAEHMLQFSDEPVARIAESCGYSYAYYFAREFRKHCGTAPRNYRERSGCGEKL